MKSMEFPLALKQFAEYCELDRNLSQRTVKMYVYYITFFFEWYQKERGLKTVMVEEINEESIRYFRLYLSREYRNEFKGELKKQTQNYFLVALRSFFRYLVRIHKKVMSPEMIELGKQRDRKVEFLKEEHLQQLFDAVTGSDEPTLRDKAIMEVLFSTGLRVSELVSLNRDMVNLKSGEFGVIGKGGKARVVFLSTKAVSALSTYLGARRDPYVPLFIRYAGPTPDTLLTDEKLRLSVRSVERMINKYRKKANLLFKVGPHMLRHSYATDLLSHGADIRSVQEMLGHKNIATTQIYTHVTNLRLKEIHEKFHSGNKPEESSA